MVAGVDGCRGGWLSVLVDGGRLQGFVFHRTFAEVLDSSAEVVAVDMPIGLPVAGPRAADLAARAFVGPRCSSVFVTPPRAVLESQSFAEAVALCRTLTGKGVSQQAYALRRRIFEVDDAARRDPRVIEVHPEASFRELAGGPLPSKHCAEGRALRRRLLARCNTSVPADLPRGLAVDFLDAAVTAWSAERFARGVAEPLPVGSSGRRGVIWR